MSQNPETLKTTCLYEHHRALGARMVEFAGWSMPIQYGSILEEHQAVRTAAGLFDVSHMARIEFSGPDCIPYLQRLFTCDVERLEPGHAPLYPAVHRARRNTRRHLALLPLEGLLLDGM